MEIKAMQICVKLQSFLIPFRAKFLVEPSFGGGRQFVFFWYISSKHWKKDSFFHWPSAWKTFTLQCPMQIADFCTCFY